MIHSVKINRRHFLKQSALWFFTALVIFIQTPPAHSKDNRSLSFHDRFQDSNTLLLRPKVGNIYYNNDIYTILKNGQLYFSIIDVIYILNLAIYFDAEDQKASGWFLREDWEIDIDIKSKKVISRKKLYLLSDDDIITDNGTIFIAQKNIEDWFNFKFIPDIPQQYVEIESPYPLPVIAKLSRKSKRVSNRTNSNSTLPRHKSDHKWLDINTADIQLGTRLQKTKALNNESLSNVRNSSILALQGQALKHDAYLLGSYNNTDGLASVVGRLSKRAEDPTLLGPLKARSYTIGDTNTVSVPLLGNTSQELGFKISNSNSTNTQFQTTTIDGEAFPGWDIELYRNNILIDIQTTESSGQYEFLNVQLFGGDNNFEIFFYGPQGEIKTRKITVPVTSALLKSKNDSYDLSASFSNTQLYANNNFQNEKNQSLHLAGSYNKRIGNALSYVGFRSRQIEGQDQNFFGAGITTSYANMILDGNIGLDLNGEVAGQASLRRAISGWDLIKTAKIQTDKYTPNGETSPSIIQLSTSVQKNFKPTDSARLNIFSRGSYSKLANETTQSSSQIGANYQFKNFNVSNNISYDSLSFEKLPTAHTLNHNVSVRYNKEGYFLRAGVDTTLYPEKEINNYFGQLTYRPNNKFSSDMRLTHKINQDKTEARLNLNYTNKYFRTSPFVEYNTNQDLYAGINLNFSVIDDPSDHSFDITSRRLSGKGLVSSLVYHDKNGNLIYDDGDDILPDVTVESLNIRRREITNDKGYSLIKDLPTNRATDIIIDKTTLPDSFMISATEGVSVLPNAGEIIELQFPVHLSGEIDGTISLTNGEKIEPIRRAAIELHPITGTSDKMIRIETALDGFYVGSEIPPGRYIMKIDNQTAQKYKAGAPAPRIIEIGYEGDVLYGYDMALDRDRPHISVEIKRQNMQATTFKKESKAEIYTLQTSGNTQSQLASLLGSYAKNKARQKSSKMSDNLKPAPPYEQVNLDSSQNAYSLASNQEIESTHNKCVELMSNGIPCSMEIIIPKTIQTSF